MKETINITYNSGYGNMTLYLPEFFPCTAKELNFLLKNVIELDYDHRDQIREDLKKYFKEAAEQEESLYKDFGKEYLDLLQKIADTKQLIKNKKLPNGLPLDDEAVKSEKDYLNVYYKLRNELKKETNDHMKKKKKLLANLATLEKWKRW